MRVSRVGLAVLKGTRHSTLDAVHLTERGPVGDRVFCLVDPRNQQVLKTVAHRSLLAATATWRQEVLSVELAGQTVAGVPVRTGESLAVGYWGRPITVDVMAGPWAAAFSSYLGRPVLLARAAAGDIVYGDQVSVITTASLAALRAVAREAPSHPRELDPGRDGARFRATFTIDTGTGRYAEAGSELAWVGAELRLGAARVRITAPVVRCKVVDFHPSSGRPDFRLLESLPRNAAGEPVFGLQGVVVQPGLVRQESPVDV